MAKLPESEECAHNWMATTDLYGQIVYFYCTKCRAIETLQIQKEVE